MREVRAAVDVQHETAAAASPWAHEPGVQLVTVPVSYRMALGIATVGSKPAAAVAGELPKLAVLDGMDLSAPAVDGRDGGDLAAPFGKPRTEGVVAVDETLDGAVEPEAVRHA